MARYLAFLAVALSTLCSVQAAQADTYNFQDLGTYGTDYMRSSNGNAINDNNQVACDSYYAIPFVVATLWQGGAMMLLPSFTDPTGYGAAYTSGINNAGQIAGTGYEAVDDFYYPFIYSNGVTTSISLPGWGGDASTGGINNNGQMVATTGVLGQAEIATTAGVTHLPLLNGIGSTQGYGINNANPVEVVGMAEPVALGSQHAVLWKNGVIYDLGSLGGPNTVAYAINDNGWVVGSADVPAVGNNAAATHAFVWIPNTPNGTTGVMHDIGVLNGGTSTTATAINNNNTVVGWGIFGIDSTSGFVWDQANGLRDLAPLIVNTNTNVPGSIANFIERVSGINSNGQICGTETWYVNDQSIEHGFVLTPTGGVAPLAPNNLQAAVPQAGAHPAAVVHPPLIATTVAPNTVNLSWNANSINETGFLIQRQTAGSGTWVNLITTSAFVQSYTDNSVQPNTSYYYVVYAINTIGSSGPSNVVLATTGPSSITVTSLAFSPASVTAGTASTATVTLSAAAPTGGEDVTITDSGTYIATVQVPAGQTTGAYTQQTSPMIDGPNTLTAQFNGTSANGTLTVTSDPTLPVPVSIAYTPNPVAVGGTTTGKVTLSAVAPTGGAPVYIFINNGYVALFTVPAGQTSITYTDTVQVAGTFTHAASYNGVQVTTNLVVGSTTAAPTITSLSPISATAGGAAFTLTVNGAGFVSGAVVKWNGVALTTTFASSLQVTAAVPAADIATAGTASVTLTNPNAQVSNTVTLTIKNPAPSLTTISPSLATSGGAAFTLTVNGAHFLTGAVVKWNSVALTTTFVSASQVTAAVPATDIASPGTASVTVTNTDAQVSNVLTFTISPSPTITSLSPTSATAGGAAFTLTVNGAGFVSGAVVKWNGVALTTTFVSSLQVTAAVPAADIATAGTASVTLTNPNSQVSGSQSFVVQAVVVPKSLVFNPNPAFSCGETLGTISLTGNAPTGGAAVALTLNGTSLGTVTVPAGQSGATVLLSLSTVTTATNITMAIAYNGGSASTTLTVNPTAVKILSLVYKPNPVIGGSSATGTVTLSAAAPAGGAVITLTGAVSYSFVVPAGQTSAGYTQPTGVVTTSTTYTFHATYNGATVNGTLTANP